VSQLNGGRTFLVDSLLSAEIEGRRPLSRDSVMFHLLNRTLFSRDVNVSNCVMNCR